MPKWPHCCIIYSLGCRNPFPAEDWIEQKIAQKTERKILVFHQHLNELELRSLARVASTIYLTTLQAAVVSLRADVDAIFYLRVPECEATPAEPAKDMVLAELFTLSSTHHLRHVGVPRGAGLERVRRLGLGKMRALSWRPQRELFW